MLSTLFAFAYPGECARLMVAQPGVEEYAPFIALGSLVCVWLLVWLLARSKLAATVSAVLLFCMPAFRLGVQHPMRQNLVLGIVLLALVLVTGVYRLFRRWRVREKDYHVVARRAAFITLSFLAVAALSFLHSISVYLSAVVAVFAGLSLSHWWHEREKTQSAKFAFGLLAFVFAFTFVFELCVADWHEGEFADRFAEEILADMGDRTWIITDGSIDDHLTLVARAQGRELNIVSLPKDEDPEYRRELAKLVREKRLGGDACGELALTLDLGVLAFVQDWFKCDPEVAKKCVVFGAPDLWFSAGVSPVPELLFFGGDPKRPADWGRWERFDKMLPAPRNWGSYKLDSVEDPVEKLRLSLRRHVGLVANNRGVWLQDAGSDPEAFALYRLVFTDIDRDNFSAMLNILTMASAKYAPAVGLRREIDEKFKKILADKNRRYLLGGLSRFYGYIRDPQMYVRLGYQWARSGMPDTALAQVHRAMDLVPSDRRTALVNMLAALYAEGRDLEKSRESYEIVLKNDARNHEALIGMMRLALMDGDTQQAFEYLERAVEAGGDDPRIDIEKAMLAMMKNDQTTAAAILHHRVDTDPDDLRAWSMLASVLMNQSDLEQDPEKKKAYEQELENTVLPGILAAAKDASDYYVNSVKAFLLLRKGVAHQREARDAFVVAIKARPDAGPLHELVLGLDISLNDKVSALVHARETLKVNRQSPIANYVMGSLALSKGELWNAETYLKRAADAKKPVDLAINDLAETYRQENRLEDALTYARKAVERSPDLHVANATLACVLMDLRRDLPEALKLAETALERSKVDGSVKDGRMYIVYARAQFLNGDEKGARISLRKAKSIVGELSPFEKKEYEELLKSVR